MPETNSLNTGFLTTPQVLASALQVQKFRAGQDFTESPPGCTSANTGQRVGFSYCQGRVVGWHIERTVSLHTTN